ncbi:MAG: hypothetical protein C4344_02105, partial [Acidimicrobiia bacterium]
VGRADPAGRLRTLEIASRALGTETHVNVLVPAGYDDPSNATRRYPVLYLLHGAGDTWASWWENTDVEQATADLDLIVVMPDAGRAREAGWYSDWRDGPQWESYHIGELVPLIDGRFRTIPERSARGVAGLSMGGFGAMSYAARHPDLFGAAASFSGAVDTTSGGPAGAAVFTVAHDQLGTPDRRVWGDYTTDEVNWRAHNPPDLSTNLRWTKLWLSTGNGVPAPGDRAQDAPTEAGVYLLNVGFHRDLTDEGIDHEWHDRGHGTHSWRYWEQDLHAALPWFMEIFADAEAAPPGAFDYRSAEPSFTVYGWTFTVDRERAQEFLDLYGVSTAGLRARGSGMLAVTTPPAYQPGRSYPVTGNGRVVADADGRLHFTVDLGPPHRSKQYTAAARVAEATDHAYWREATVVITD